MMDVHIRDRGVGQRDAHMDHIHELRGQTSCVQHVPIHDRVHVNRDDPNHALYGESSHDHLLDGSSIHQ